MKNRGRTSKNLHKIETMHRLRLAVIVFTAVQFLFLPVAIGQNEWKTRFVTPFEQGDGWDTADYKTAIKYYKDLASASERVTITEMGKTDSGFPLHLVLIDSVGSLAPKDVVVDSRSVILINNAIHPGESDGVDASMALARDLAMDVDRYGQFLEKVIVAIIPVYNIGGALNRNTGTRANQNGPREYGFRGNARNYDLNRDFVKCDTRNAQSFAEIFHLLDPDLFIDTHVSNGADYQHVMTTSHSQKDKLGYGIGEYLQKTFEPKLFGRMSESGFPTVPYVNSGGRPPEQGFSQFLETPRYSTGFTALFQTMGFMTETHMLKPYPQRVEATRVFLDHSIELLALEGERIQQIRRDDREAYHRQETAPIAWRVDRENPSRLEFHGFESSYRDSTVTTGKRLFYDREKPFVRNIPYFDHYVASEEITLPAGYLIPRQWQGVIDLMRLNRVELQIVDQKQTVEAETYRIGSVKSRSTPYEGHYFHDTVSLEVVPGDVVVSPGDVIIPIHQDHARYVVETLEPAAMDSLFRWNRFDTILQRKEYFSPYVFEETAKRMLEENERLREEFEQKKKDDAEFAEDRYSQLQFLYERSNHYEASHLRYPIARLKTLPKTISPKQKSE